MGTDIGAGTVAALVSLMPFVLVEFDVIELPTAYDVALWLGVGVIGACDAAGQPARRPGGGADRAVHGGRAC